MKRILCLLLALCLLLPLLVACAPEEDVIKVGVLKGTTGMGIVMMAEEADPRYKITFYDASNPQTLLSDLTSGKVDLATIPTNAAAQLYNKTEGKIRMLALNTFGVLYLVDTTGTVHSLADLAGKTVHVPMKGANPEFIFRHILAENGIEANIVTDISDADLLSQALLSNEGENAGVQIAVLPQPKVTVVKNQAAAKGVSLTVPIDLSAEWNKIEDTPIAQGCLVGRTDFVEENQPAVLEFLRSYRASVDFVAKAENLDEAANLIVKYTIIPKAPIAKAALPYCGIGYSAGTTMKATLDAFYRVLYDLDPKAVGGRLPGDDFYYRAD